MIVISALDIPTHTLAAVESLLAGSAVAYRVERQDPTQDAPGGFRRTDPDTSRKAAFAASPRTGSRRHVALMAVVRAGTAGATAAEVELTTRIPGIWKRLSELQRGGWILVNGTRMNPGSSAEANVYVATPKGQLYAQHTPHA